MQGCIALGIKIQEECKALVDKDGFTLVVRGSAYGQAVEGGVGVASRKFMDERVEGKDSKSKRKRHKEGNEILVLHAFQIHEKKRNGALFHIPLFISNLSR